MIRSFFRTADIPSLNAPYNTIRAKIYYPALYGDTPMERDTGAIPVEPMLKDMPVVIMTPGVNLDIASYGWLARYLAEREIVTVLFDLISEIMPGVVNLTPGLDVMGLMADSKSEKPPGMAYKPLIELLKSENKTGVLAGSVDMNNIWFGGHSAGGSTALMAASPHWFPGLKGVFAYAAHTGMSAMMGYPQGYIKSVPDVPSLIIGGTRDGCIANSAHRYGDDPGDAIGRVVKTYEEGVTRDQGDSILALIEGANHFTIGHPVDDSSGRAFIDYDEDCDGDEARALIAKMIHAFIMSDQSKLNSCLKNSMISDGRMK